MICTGQSQETLSDNEVLTKLSKADVRSHLIILYVVLNAWILEIGLQKTQSEVDDRRLARECVEVRDCESARPDPAVWRQ